MTIDVVYNGSFDHRQELTDESSLIPDLEGLCDERGVRRKTTLEILFEAGGGTDVQALARREARSTEPKKPRHSAYQRAKDTSRAQKHLAVITALEQRCGPEGKAEIQRDKAFQGALDVENSRTAIRNRRLGHRNALVRLMKVDIGVDTVFDVTDLVEAYVDVILAISANVAAISTKPSTWRSHFTWFQRALPIVVEKLGEHRLKLDFERHLAAARASLAPRSLTRPEDFLTGPTPKMIAHQFQHTTLQLRIAQANKHGLTSIDAEDVKTRDRKRKEAKRRSGPKPMKRRSECTKTVEYEALAQRLGCSLSTIKRHKHDLDAFIGSRGG